MYAHLILFPDLLYQYRFCNLDTERVNISACLGTQTPHAALRVFAEVVAIVSLFLINVLSLYGRFIYMSLVKEFVKVNILVFSLNLFAADACEKI
jgi:hypothetical protein